MPDTTSLEMPAGGTPSKGIPQSVMVLGAVAGIVGLVLLLKNQGGGGTTAAGSSINAALGSIQEENMNLLGTTQAGFMQTSQQIAALGSQDMANYTQMSNQITSNFADLNTKEAQYWADNNTRISSGFSNLSGQLTGLSSQVQGYHEADSANFQHINDLITGLADMEATGQANSASYFQNLGALMQEIGVDVHSIGGFLGWEYYQLPNRYAPMIPAGVNPAGWH